MRVGRIGHATLLVRTDDVACVMDPVLAAPFDCGSVIFDPPITVDARHVRDLCNVIVLSHEHADHFDVASLDQLDRDAVVYYPHGARSIAHALERLGFAQRRAVHPGEEDITLADLRFVPTASRVPFAEMGMVFASEDATLWNLVDSRIDGAIIDFVRREVGRVDLALAGYQPLIQRELGSDALGSGFPYDAYGTLLAAVAAIAPRWVVPAACGFRYVEPWLNDRGLPMTEAQFARDVAALGARIEPIALTHGAEVEIEGGTLRRLADLPFVERLGATSPSHDWRPDRGVPALVDRDPCRHGEAALRADVTAFLDGELLASLATHHEWLARMARLRAVWRLEVVYPGGAVEQRWLDFGDDTLRWTTARAGLFAGLHTSIAASAIVGLRNGEVHPDRLTLGDMRIFARLYTVSADGIVQAGSDADEPLCRVLVPGSRERHLDRALRRLGC
jgi:L-ascorbate metabolism protein UlaG (beta-lactamase superfamily)